MASLSQTIRELISGGVGPRAARRLAPLVQASDSGGSSAVVAFIGTYNTPDGATNEAVGFDSTTISGPGAAHINADGSGNLVINDEGLYLFDADTRVVTDGGNAEAGIYIVLHAGSPALPADSWLNIGSGEADFALSAGVQSWHQLSFPPIHLAAGTVLEFHAVRYGSASCVLNLGNLTVTKIA